MSKEYKLGTHSDNDIVITKGKLGKESRIHAIIHFKEDNTILLEDKESTNGTFVNDFRIKKKIIDLNDKLRFGDYEAQLHYFFKEEKGKLILREDNDFSEEFELLKKEDNVFRNELRKIEIRKITLQLWRIVTAFPIIYQLMLLLDDDKTQRSTFTLIISILIFILIAFVIFYKILPSRKEKIDADFEKLITNYKENYVCPKCRKFLGVLNTNNYQQTPTWSEWKEIGKHDYQDLGKSSFSCDAKFV